MADVVGYSRLRATGGNLWAERFNRDLTDIFSVQDDVTGKIVAALTLKRDEARGT
ncbi:MAG: hypothetical protein JO288_22975 [Hyphomicrobiales bacterium]|nr:hypothetical protein [Hyphomicrobiales bacterium]